MQVRKRTRHTATTDSPAHDDTKKWLPFDTVVRGYSFWVVLSKKREPVLIAKAEPLEPEGVVWSAWCARAAQLSARSFSRGVVARQGCDLKS